MYIDRDLLRQCSSDDAVNLLVDIQFGQTAALGVVGHTDGHWFRPLGDWHSDLKQLQRVVKKQRELKECILMCTVKNSNAHPINLSRRVSQKSQYNGTLQCEIATMVMVYTHSEDKGLL